MAPVDGELVAVDPELIRVISRGAAQLARRVHAEMCDAYQADARKAKLRREQVAFESRPAPRRARKAGL